MLGLFLEKDILAGVVTKLTRMIRPIGGMQMIDMTLCPLSILYLRKSILTIFSKTLERQGPKQEFLQV